MSDIDRGENRELDAAIEARVFDNTIAASGGFIWRIDGDNWDIVPAYSSDYNAVALIEPEIERRGLQEQYINVLLLATLDHIDDAFITSSEHGDRSILAHAALWAVLRATPEQRCRAALWAVEAVNE